MDAAAASPPLHPFYFLSLGPVPGQDYARYTEKGLAGLSTCPSRRIRNGVAPKLWVCDSGFAATRTLSSLPSGPGPGQAYAKPGPGSSY